MAKLPDCESGESGSIPLAGTNSEDVVGDFEMITDHALVRYFERVIGIDMEELRKMILTENVKKAIRLNASGVVVNGFRYVIKGGRIVTILSTKNGRVNKK